ncbi:MAG: type II toxin-antitoxin system VapC family toxin [Treponema sp.]|nr:type II toxin-antitoxin system VapC family toxin [Treponema sp.]MBQ7167002.1 type II toxin-antitoxin system VapC family toxin [Treponema sp.]
MNGNILDTNVIIRLLNGDENVRSAIYKMTDICIPVVVVGELLFGAEKSQKREQNRRNYLAFCAPYPVLDVTQKVADEYGKLKKALQAHGNIMPENDMWIAATALANGMTVVTQDKHFEHIDGLLIIKV